MKKVFVSLIFIILFANLIYATFNLGNPKYSIQESYNPADTLKGWIDIELNDEPIDSILNDSEGNSIKLYDLLKLNQNQGNKSYNFSCSTTKCLPEYTATNQFKNITFNLNANKGGIIGLEFTGKVTEITSIDFVLESNAPEGCFNQLEIDFLYNKITNWENNKASTNNCKITKNYGCFDDTKNYERYGLDKKGYCQEITLSKSPGFTIGAWIDPNEDSRKLKMQLINKDSAIVDECDLPETSQIGENFCNITYSPKTKENYYVCIAATSPNGNEEIIGYNDNDKGCGYYDWKSDDYAYKIFAMGKKFSAINTIKIENFLQGSEELDDLANLYLQDRYIYTDPDCSGQQCYFDCSTTPCIIPIKFKSLITNQQITIKNLTATYRREGGQKTIYNFSNLQSSEAVINSKPQKLYLDKGNFSLPLKNGYFDYEFYLNDNEIFSQEIFIEAIPIIKLVTPTQTAAAYPTTFTVEVQSQNNITKYKWDFGDGQNKTTTENKVIHTYSEWKRYTLTITITDSNQKTSSKIFQINVDSPENIIDSTLKKMQTNFAKIDSQIKNIPAFAQTNIKSAIKFDEINTELKQIKKDYLTANSPEEYIPIMTQILQLKIPESIIEISNLNFVTFYPNPENINLNILQLIGGGEYDSSNEKGFINAIFTWNQKNLETKINFKEFSVIYEQVEKPLLTTFELKINAKGELSENPYLIMQKLGELNFKGNYQEKEESGYTYIELTQDKTTIEFSTIEEISFIDLPLFISPRIDSLFAGEMIIDSEKEEKTSKWIFFILIIFFLFLIGITIYIALQIWYKKRYENYLFKNKNELYNLITYIHNSQEKGLEGKEIMHKLKKVGWKSEQISYVIKKYAGKRTGMAEIDVGKFINKFKKPKVVQKRNFPPTQQRKFNKKQGNHPFFKK